MLSVKYPWDNEPAPVAPPRLPEPTEKPAKRRGRRPAAISGPASSLSTAPLWLYHHLTISGPAETVAAFAAGARGSGIIPWQLDLAALEEDVFVRAVSQPAGQRTLTVHGCRILARQFRERVEARQQRAAALTGRSQACPFDLQTLLPVPRSILQLGPTHPDALAWLAEHWGVTDRLRQIAVRPKPTTGRRLPRTYSVISYGFFTDGETPHAAITQLASRWPALRFALQPRPAD
jgi:hypothetical protein